MRSPKVYATFLLWMLSELFERLPEVGDPDKPKLVFFFDEAHLLFTDAPTALVEKIEQVVRLIRSKGVGVYFVTQSPSDMPDTVLGQLGNRVQHALRAFTPRDQKAVKVAADTLRAESGDRHELGDHGAGRRRGAGVGARREGEPDDHRARVDHAARRRGSARSPTSERDAIRAAQHAVYGHYEQTVDRESAYEKLTTGPPRRRGGAARRPVAAPSRTAGRRYAGQAPAASHGPLSSHSLRHDGTARRQARRPGPVGGEERRAIGRLRRRPRDPAGRAGIDSRRNDHWRAIASETLGEVGQVGEVGRLSKAKWSKFETKYRDLQTFADFVSSDFASTDEINNPSSPPSSRRRRLTRSPMKPQWPPWRRRAGRCADCRSPRDRGRARRNERIVLSGDDERRHLDAIDDPHRAGAVVVVRRAAEAEVRRGKRLVELPDGLDRVDFRQVVDARAAAAPSAASASSGRCTKFHS